MPTDYVQNNVFKVYTCDYVNLCGTADRLMLTQSVAMQMVLYTVKLQQFSSVQFSYLLFVCADTTAQGQKE